MAALLLGLLCWSSCCGERATAGAQDWIYRALQTDDGLPDNCVTGVVQSADGYLWVATRGGLLRFNGVDFTPVPLPELPGVLNRVMHMMRLDREGRMWMEMDRGPIVCLGPGEARSFGLEEGIPRGRVYSMAEDSEGAMWLAYFGGLCRIKEGICENFGAADGLSASRAEMSVGNDARGEIWYAKDQKLGVFRDGKFQEKLTLGEGRVRITASAAGGLWLAVGESLFRFHEEAGLDERGRLPKRAEARALLEDQAGALWIGTSISGLFRLGDGLLESIQTSHQEVDCLTEDREGNIWAGTNGGGLEPNPTPRGLARLPRRRITFRVRPLHHRRFPRRSLGGDAKWQPDAQSGQRFRGSRSGTRLEMGGCHLRDGRA